MGLLTIVLMMGRLLAQSLDTADTDLATHLTKADEVLALAKKDFINAAKDSEKVFDAARLLSQRGDDTKASGYFVQGLQMSPWNLEAQLSYARTLIKLSRKDEAIEIADMVASRSETDEQSNRALALAGKPPVSPPPFWKGRSEEPCICFIKIGPVEDVILQQAMDRISRTLGMPAYTLEIPIGLPNASRSALNRWVEKQIIPAFKWSHPALRELLLSLDAQAPEEVPPAKLVRAIIDQMRAEGLTKEATQLETGMKHQQKWDKQWQASAFIKMIKDYLQTSPMPGAVTVVGITAADLYDDNTNFLFGSALTGGRVAVTSYARYTGEFNQEPPERKKLLSRLHKQLLSGIGYALGVPRPTDPTSARAYPASLPEHDAKSEYMSAACRAGFEKALNRSLPEESLPPEKRGALQPK